MSLQIGTEGHYRVSPLGPALDLFDSMNNSGLGSSMSLGSMNGYNGYGHESAYVTPHSMNQVTFSKQQQDGTESNMNILKRTTIPIHTLQLSFYLILNHSIFSWNRSVL